jgi:hypothetical protein
MTPKEKAKELYDKMYDYSLFEEEAKRCSLIAVEEIIASNPISFDEDDNCIAKQWWKEVKTEIEKL